MRYAAIAAAAVLVYVPVFAQVNFVEDFQGSEINSNGWADGDNGWIVDEPTQTTLDGTPSTARVFARTDLNGGAFVNISQDFSTTPITNRVTVTWDYLDGTGVSVNRFFASDTNGTRALQVWFDSDWDDLPGGTRNLRLEAAALGGYFLTPEYGLKARFGDYATITITFDPATDLITLWASSTNGKTAGPFTMPFYHSGVGFTDLDDVSVFRWETQALASPGTDWNLTTVTIKEHSPIAITQADIDDTVGLQFNSEVGVVYGLECTTNTVDLTGWAATGASIVGDGTAMTLFDPARNDSNKAYRVVDVPVP